MSEFIVTQSHPAFELKGSVFTLMVLKLCTTELAQIQAQLDAKLKQAPQFFYHAPIIIDFSLFAPEIQIDVAEIIILLRKYDLLPVAISGASEAVQQQALALNLPLLPTQTTAKKGATEQETPHSPTAQAKVITQPIRSGQQVVSLEGDLIIFANVSHGAEVLARGNIHVYGALRGRALAGVSGDIHARIFCQQFEAEIISIAGHYQINEDVADHVQGQAAAVYLENEHLHIQTLTTPQRR